MSLGKDTDLPEEIPSLGVKGVGDAVLLDEAVPFGDGVPLGGDVPGPGTAGGPCCAFWPSGAGLVPPAGSSAAKP